MRIIELIDGAFEIRWTWLPLWLGTNPKLRGSLEQELRTIIALSGITDSDDDLDLLHKHVVRRFQEMFQGMKGLDRFLDGLRLIDPS